MLPEIIFIGNKESKFINYIRELFNKIKKIKIVDNENIIKFSDDNNICFVSTLNNLGSFDSESDITYQAMFNNIIPKIKKKMIDVNMYLYKNRIQPEIINNTSYIPVGTSIIIPVNNNNCFIAGSPTKSYQNNVLNLPINYYYFLKAVLKSVNNHNMAFSSNKIEKIVIPEITQNKEDIMNMFNAYFDIAMGLDVDRTPFSTSTVYYFKAPLTMNYSIYIPKKRKNNIS